MKNLKKYLSISGIGILLTIFLAYGSTVFFESPNYNECYEEIVFPEGRELNETKLAEQRECTERLNAERESAELARMIALIVSGILVIIIGVVITPKTESVGNGIFAGGLLTIIIGTLMNWGVLNKYARLALIGIALGILIYLGYKKIDRK